MGNCLRHHHESSQVHWGGEDWTPALMTEKERSEAVSKPAAEYVSKSTSSSSSLEVKIKITKKQLEQYLLHHRKLLQGAEGLSVHQALAQLISLSADCEAAQHRHGWRPRLQSIPEV